nr:hypothetical protein [Catenulispora pinisilvae]
MIILRGVNLVPSQIEEIVLRTENVIPPESLERSTGKMRRVLREQ